MKSKKTISTFSINCNGDLIDLTIPKVMGIINVTPDSFYDGGKFKDEKSLLKQAEKMKNNGYGKYLFKLIDLTYSPTNC